MISYIKFYYYLYVNKLTMIKKNNIIAIRINDELNKLLLKKAVQETTKRNKIVKISDIVREILEEGVR